MLWIVDQFKGHERGPGFRGRNNMLGVRFVQVGVCACQRRRNVGATPRIV
jgi:hypothetical protein